MRFLTTLALGLLAVAPTFATEIACTEAALESQIATLNGACSGDKTITFSCAAGTTIYIDDEINTRKTCDGGDPNEISCTSDSDCTTASRPTPCSLNTHGCNASGTGCTGAGTPYQCCTGSGTGTCCSGDMSDRDITCDGVVIDGENKVTFSLDPPCEARLSDPATECTELEGQSYLFHVRADNVVLKNFDMENFWEGIWLRGVNDSIINVDATTPCDDAFTISRDTGGSPLSAEGGLIQNSTVTDGCDKCISMSTNNSLSYPNYNGTLDNVTIDSCRVAVSAAGDGRFLIKNSTFSADPAFDHTYDHPLQIGSTSLSDDSVVYLQDNYIEGARFGMIVEGDGDVVSLGGNRWVNNSRCGIWVQDSASLLLEGDTIEGSGTITSVNCEGAVYLETGGDGNVDLGGGSLTIDGQAVSSSGLNRFINNEDGSSGNEEVGNHTTTNIKAENNWWGQAGGPSAGDVTEDTGLVDTTPYLTADIATMRYIGPSGTDSGDCTSALSPCASPNYAIQQMVDGDTLIVQDGTYTLTSYLRGVPTGCVAGTQYTYMDLSQLNCATLGCTIQGETPASPPTLTAGGSLETGIIAKSVNGWTVKDLIVEAPEEAFIIDSTADGITIQDVDFPLTSGAVPKRCTLDGNEKTPCVQISSRVCDSQNVFLQRIDLREKGSPCDVSGNGRYGLGIEDSTNVTLTESFVGYIGSLALIKGVTNLDITRNTFEHWVEHGLQFSEGGAVVNNDVLIENNIFKGTTSATGGDSQPCFYGDNQWESGGSSELLGCIATEYLGKDRRSEWYNFCPSADATGDTACEATGDYKRCTSRPADTSGTVWRCTSDSDCAIGGDTCDQIPVQCEYVHWSIGSRSVDIYEVQDLIVRNNTFAGHGYAPGVAWGSDSGGCSSCDNANWQFTNNLLYDMGKNTGSTIMRFSNLQKSSGFTMTGTFIADGNFYSFGGYGSTREWQCGECGGVVSTLAAWKACNCYGIANPGAGEQEGTATFTDYGNEDYTPLNGSSPQVDAGVNTAGYCASVDFTGASRTDGNCDVGAYEYAATGGTECTDTVDNDADGNTDSADDCCILGFNTETCCGDNTKQAGETCDGTDLDSNDCTTVPGGFTSGTLTCNGTCDGFITAECTSEAAAGRIPGVVLSGAKTQ